MKWKNFYNSNFAFPVIFITLHMITYGVFLYIANDIKTAPWHSYERSNYWNLFMFYETWWPNWCGLWVILGVFRKKINWLGGFLYLFFLWIENFWIGWDYAEAFGERALKKVLYQFTITKLTFGSMTQTVLHVSLGLCAIHIAIIGSRAIFGKYNEQTQIYTK